MVVNTYYINQHLARQDAIKLRALEINNFLSDVDTGYDYCMYDHCNVVPEYLDIENEYCKVILSYEDGDWDQRSWSIPFELFDKSDEELVEYAKHQAAAQSALDKKVDYARLRKQAKELGYRLVPVEGDQ